MCIRDSIEALRCLPGVGPKSAQRMAYHLLQRDRRGAERLARGLDAALQLLHHCARCNNFTESEICDRCLSPRRDASQLCIVEMPIDANSMEQTHAYNGLYYVLMGRLSPVSYTHLDVYKRQAYARHRTGRRRQGMLASEARH